MARRSHPAWLVLAATFLVLLAGAGIRATPSVLIVPLEQEFGWSRATISLAISVNIFLYGLMGPFAGGAHAALRHPPHDARGADAARRRRRRSRPE